jgi:transcription initiation factor TFIID subunit TAF12
LSRKLEQARMEITNDGRLWHTIIIFAQLREEKIDLENALEAESESHVNRLSRELTALRQAQQQQQQQQQQGNGGVSHSQAALQIPDPNAPSAEIMLEAMRRENDQLRGRLVDTERDYVRISRLNEIYREELIEHRRRVSRFSFFFWSTHFVSRLDYRWTTW